MAAGERLGIQDLHTIKEDLWDGRTKWSDIGGALKVDPTELEAIARHGDPAKCFGEMLSTWLKGAGDPPRTWTTIVKALRGKIVDLGALADEIEAKYKLGTSGSKSPTKGTGNSINGKQKSKSASNEPPSTPSMKFITKWKITPTIASKWKLLADLLDIDHNETSTIDTSAHGNAETACREVISKWLNGQGSPCTWEELFDAMDSLGYTEFVKGLREKLNN